MSQAFPLIGTLALTGCVAVVPVAVPVPADTAYAVTRAGDALLVRRTATPFTYSDGAEARRAADRYCGGKVASSPEDNYRAGAWIYPRGCA